MIKLFGLDETTFYFDTQVPDVVLETAGRIVLDDYRKAFVSSQEGFGQREARDVYPYLRRATIETDLARLPGLFPGVVTVAPIPNKTRNAWHKEIHCGRVVLTQAKVLRALS